MQSEFQQLASRNSEQIAIAQNNRLERSLNGGNVSRQQGFYRQYDESLGMHLFETVSGDRLPAKSITNGAMGLRSPVSVFRPVGGQIMMNAMPR